MGALICKMLLTNQCFNRMHGEFINLFHRLGLPMHFNHKGNKNFNNLQRISLLILYRRSKKSLVDFCDELKKSLRVKWLNLKKIPGKSTVHDWLKLFKMIQIRKLNSLLKAKNISLTAIDGTGFDSWQRSRHYERKIWEVHASHMPYAKVDLFIDVKTQQIIDFSLEVRRIHDAKAAEIIFKRNKLSGFDILADKGYDSEKLHELVRSKGGKLFAPVRKMNKVSNKRRPGGKYRRGCLELPEFMGMRSLVETVNSVLKRKQISSLRSKKKYMKQREFGWHVVLYNINRRIAMGSEFGSQQTIFLIVWIYVIPDGAHNHSQTASQHNQSTNSLPI